MSDETKRPCQVVDRERGPWCIVHESYVSGDCGITLTARIKELEGALMLIDELAQRESMGGLDAPDTYGTIGRQARLALSNAKGGGGEK